MARHKRQFWVYILRCADDSLYTGYTTDIGTRIMLHTIGKGAKYTRGRGPFDLVYLKEYATRSSAMRREAQIKKLTKKQKLALIEKQDQELLKGIG